MVTGYCLGIFGLFLATAGRLFFLYSARPAPENENLVYYPPKDVGVPLLEITKDPEEAF